MSRLSREQKRELKRQRSVGDPGGHAGEPAPPLDVHVPVSAGGATVGGVPLAVEPGETVQGAVLDHLHRIAGATGRPVLARVHDERIGFVVPLQVYGDGSSRYAGEPVRVGTPPPPPPALPSASPAPSAVRRDAGTQLPHPAPERSPEAEFEPEFEPAPEAVRERSSEPAPEPAPEAVPEAVSEPVSEGVPVPEGASVTVPEPERVSEPAPLVWPEPVSDEPSGPESASGLNPEPTVWPEAPSTHVLRVVQGPVSGALPGVAVAPTGEFGPPPEMPPVPAPLPPAPAPLPLAPERSTPAPRVVFARNPSLAAEAMAMMEPDPEPKPTPARGFDAVAESVLTPVVQTEGAAFLAEPVTRINEAVRTGRIDEAAALAEQTVTEAARSLGPEHPEVLRLGELSAYIAYLAGDALRAFHLSLDLARVHRRHGDPEAAYGNVQSAATAWRAVRDPAQGLNLGGALIEVWTGLVADGGPAADDLEQLDSARTRMGRLAERARAVTDESAP